MELKSGSNYNELRQGRAWTPMRIRKPLKHVLIFNNMKRVFYLNIATLIGLLLCHYLIISANGRNSIIIDIILITLFVFQLYLNGYSVYLLFKKFSWLIALILFLSMGYYCLLFFFPLFPGTR